MDEQEMFKKAARIFEIEIIETIRIKCGKGTTKYFNYVLIGDKDFYKFKNAVAKIGVNNSTLDLFLSGCLYFGKGQADRPFRHFDEVLNSEVKNEKVFAIRKIWERGDGVVVLSFFHDSSSCVAATREAIMIDFVGLDKLNNQRKGSYYGGVKQWGVNVLLNMGKFYIIQIMTKYFDKHVEPVMRKDFYKKCKWLRRFKRIRLQQN